MTNPPNPEVAILNAALELPIAQRAAYLEQVCASNAALRERVQELLQAHEQADDFLEAPPAGSNLKRTMLVNIPFTEKPGDKIGRYKLLQQIGEGGCGVVYMAEQEEPVRRRVALKVIKLGMDTKSVIARFEAERQALALMDHPNIAKVLDAGATETGRPYFVMELVRGIKITDYCDENKVSTADRLKLFIQVCQAIQHAHQKGIIHRDIKPSNILVTVNDGEPVPKVIDFGIAKATQGRLTDKTLFTAFEQFIGTPAYMSPEQAVMTSQDIDTRSDIYSLGVLLYELLTGKTPFDADELFQVGLDAMRRIIREKEPPKPSTRLSTMLDAERTLTAKHRQTESPKLVHLVRGDLDWIVMRSLEKDRARRYETANGFAADILRHLNNEPVNASPPSNIYRFQKAIRRNKRAFAAMTAIAVVLLVGVVASTSQAIRAKRAESEQFRLRQQAESERAKALVEALKNRQVAQFLEDMLKDVGPQITRGYDTKLMRQILDRTAQRMETDLKGQPEVEAELSEILGGTYETLGEPAKAEKMYNDALALRKSVFGAGHPKVSESLGELGAVVRRKDPAAAETIARQALAVAKSSPDKPYPELARALGVLATVLQERGDFDGAEKLLREQVELAKKMVGDGHVEVAYSLNELADLLRARGDLAGAEENHRKALIMEERLAGETIGIVFTALNDIAAILRQRGDPAGAEAVYREALAIESQPMGKGYENCRTLENLGSLLHDRRDLAGAEGAYRDAWRIYTELKLNENTAFGALDKLISILREEGKLTEISQLVHDAADSNNSEVLNHLARFQATSSDSRLRNGTNAIIFSEKAVTMTARKFPDFLDTLAAAYAEAGQFTNAVGVEREAIALLKDDQGKQEYGSRLKLYDSNTPYREGQ